MSLIHAVQPTRISSHLTLMMMLAAMTYFIIANNAQAQTVDVTNECTTPITTLLGQVPPIDGADDLQGMLDLSAQLESIADDVNLDNYLTQLTPLLDKIDPNAIAGQLDTIGTLLPEGGGFETPAIMGGSINRFLKGPAIAKTDAKLRKLHTTLSQKYNTEQNTEERQKILGQLTKINGVIEQWGSIESAAGRAETALNDKLEDSNLGGLVSSGTDLLSLAQNPSQLGSNPQILNDILNGFNLGNLNSIGETLDKLCGLLPEGSMKNSLLDMATKAANGDFSSAMDRLQEYAKGLLADKLRDKLALMPAGAAKDALNNALTKLQNGDYEGALDGLKKATADGLLTGLADLTGLSDTLNDLKDLKKNGLTGLGNKLKDKINKGSFGAPSGSSSPAQNLLNTVGNATCEDLKTMNPLQVSTGMRRETLLQCINGGMDPPKQFRKARGSAPISTPIGNAAPVNLCRPTSDVNDCPNNEREYREAPAGYTPLSNPNLNIPEVPWGNVPDMALPCGAIGTLSEVAMQSLMGNVSVSSISGIGNGGLKNMLMGSLLDLFSSKFSDCQDGKLWGILRYVVGVLIQPGSFTIDVSNSTFLAPAGTYVTIPIGSDLNIDLLGSSPTPIILPNGGSFQNIKGETVNLGKNVQTSFRSDGTVITSNGNQYRVDPQKIIALDPHGLIQTTRDAEIPINPQATVFPMGPATKLPEWAK